MLKKTMKRILPQSVWSHLPRMKRVLLTRWFESAGYTLAPKDDYYSPLPSTSCLKANMARWNRPSALSALEYDLETMKWNLSHLLSLYLDEFSAIPS